jgi:hypothetical protein
MLPRSTGSIVVLATAIALLTGCGPISSVTFGKSGRHASRVETSRRPGPPPHAPAHGHRYKQMHAGREIQLEFDSGLGVYVVLDFPDRYYWDGHYLRLEGGTWYSSAEPDGGWAPVTTSRVPPGLQKQQQKPHQKAKKRGKPPKSAPAKGRW